MFLVGLVTVGQLSFWGNYLPHVFPVHLRGTGESFAANIGGRMLGTSAAAVTSLVAGLLPYESAPLKFSTAAAIVGTAICLVGLAVLDPAMLGDKADPFATPLEILPEWYLYPVFQILRVVPNKLLGIALQTMIPLGLMLVPFIESFNKFQNPFRRPVAMAVFLFGTLTTIYLGIGAALPIDKSLTLGLF